RRGVPIRHRPRRLDVRHIGPHDRKFHEVIIQDFAPGEIEGFDSEFHVPHAATAVSPFHINISTNGDEGAPPPGASGVASAPRGSHPLPPFGNGTGCRGGATGPFAPFGNGAVHRAGGRYHRLVTARPTGGGDAPRRAGWSVRAA